MPDLDAPQALSAPCTSSCCGGCGPNRKGAAPDCSTAALEIDETLLERFGGRGPRYTSYPTADRFHPGIGGRDLAAELRARRGRTGSPLGLYVHIPFCRTVCWYCACNKIGTRHTEQSTPYLHALKLEADLLADALGTRERVSHLHFGGGTPTFMPDDELADLLAHLRSRFEFAPDEEGEYSIELDPRTVDGARMERLRSLGLNRASLGVQDFDPEVQRAVNRIQPWQQTATLMEAARRAGFRSVNVDLIYGLPRQTVETLRSTIALTIELAPDRIALYNYAHLPHLFKPQRRIHEHELPTPSYKARMFEQAVRSFESAGYRHLGLDHFAREGDELAVAQREGRLHRNFQGYCSHASGDLIGLGVSAISSVGDIYAQNERTLDNWLAALERRELPIARGIRLDADDHLRRDLIAQLMCNFRADRAGLAARHGSAAHACFDAADEGLAGLVDAGAVRVDSAGVEVLPRGRLLVRAVAMAFDRHLASSPTSAYSRIA